MHLEAQQESNRESNLLRALLLLFMLVPSVLLIKVWPIAAGFSDGLALLLGALLGSVALLRSESGRLVLTPVLGLLLLFVLVLGVSVIVNSYSVPAAWRWYFLFLGFSGLLVFGAAELLEALGTDRYIAIVQRYLWYGVMLYAILSLLRYYGVLQGIFPSFKPSDGRMGGMWTQANLNSLTLWLGVLAAVFHCSWRKQRWQFVCSVLFLGWGIACSASRVSWLFSVSLLLLVGLASFGPFRMMETLAQRRQLAGAVLAVMVLLVIVPFANAPLNQWLTDKGLVDRSTTQGVFERDVLRDKYRTSEWQKVALTVPHMSTKDLLFGVGPGHYSRFSTENDDRIDVKALNNGTWGNAHNIFVMVFVEAGLVGLLVLTFIFVSIGWQILRRPLGANRLFLAGCIGLLFIQSNLEFPLWYAWFLMLFGLLMLPLYENRRAKIDSRLTKPFVGGGCIVITLIVLLSVGTSYASFARIALKQDHEINDFMQLMRLSEHGLFGPYASLWRYREFEPVTVDLEEQIEEVEQVANWQARDLVMLRQYFLYLMDDRLEDACAVGRQTARRYPGAAPFMIDHVREKRRAPESALPRLKECIDDGLSVRGKTLIGVRFDNARKAMEEGLR